ncbi:DUF6252 family protein [Pedobacter sp. NJ-S-72]
MNEIQETVKATSPGFIATAKDGYWMNAKIEGKEWIASAMLPADKSSSIRVQGENNGESIGFYISMRGVTSGKHIIFSDNKGADLMINDEIGIWGGRKGEVVITKINNTILEGTFSFTANSSQTSKLIQVTGGTFRLPLVWPR